MEDCGKAPLSIRLCHLYFSIETLHEVPTEVLVTDDTIAMEGFGKAKRKSKLKKPSYALSSSTTLLYNPSEARSVKLFVEGKAMFGRLVVTRFDGTLFLCIFLAARLSVAEQGGTSQSSFSIGRASLACTVMQNNAIILVLIFDISVDGEPVFG